MKSSERTQLSCADLSPYPKVRFAFLGFFYSDFRASTLSGVAVTSDLLITKSSITF